MSLQTWMKKFYPCRADSKAALADPIAHSLRKWEGLTKSNLKKHEVTREEAHLWDASGNIFIDDTSCALCQKYRNEDSGCTNCPLYMANGQTQCDDENSREVNLYFKLVDDGDPMPMIRALRKTQKLFGKGAKK